MAIRKHISLARSENVMNYILASGLHLDAYIESYQNGREQGHSVVHDVNHVFYVAEHRNVDKMVVYHGSMSMQSLSEDAYKNQYMADDERDAAMYILKALCDLQGEEFEMVI